MQGVGIFYGDLLIVDRHETVRHGDVNVANCGCQEERPLTIIFPPI
jgi:SOS-response transcriptional repressor LexA